MTQNVVEEQDRQRQKLLQLVRGTVSKKVEIKKLWRKIISHLTQERYAQTHNCISLNMILIFALVRYKYIIFFKALHFTLYAIQI